MARTIEGGITLVDLTDGQSYYTFVRYSKNADGSGYVATPTSETIYIGVYAGPLSSPPVYSDSGWTWSKYVGDDGGQGPQGVSVTAGRELYYLTTTGTAPSQITVANQIVSTDTPNKWSSVVVTYQTGADYYTCIETTLSNGQKVWSAPSKNIALTTASADAQEAKTIATGINQYFWWIPNDHSTSVPAGVYMTQIPSTTFKSTPAGGNIIMRSDGMYIRHGATLDAQVTSSGLTVKKGGIEAGTFNSDNYVYAWSEDRSDRSLAINGSGSKTDWRFLAGKKFGVDKAGNLYAGNAIVNGTLIAGANSKIGPWNVTDTSIWYGNDNFGNNGGIYLGTSGLSLGSTFKVTSNGQLTATGADISGKVTITTGSNVYTTDDVNPLEIGGRNLLLNTDMTTTWSSISLNTSNYAVKDCYKTYSPVPSIFEVDDLVTISFDWTTTAIEGNFHVECGAATPYTWGTVVSSSGEGNRNNKSNYVDISSSIQSGHLTVTFKVTSSQASAAETLQWLRIRVDGTGMSGKTFTVSNAKAEKGNKATDWSPAPEDVQAEIDAKKSVHTIDSTYKPNYSTALNWAKTLQTYSNNGIDTTGVKVGDTVRLGVLVNDFTENPTVYVVGTVTAIGSASSFTMMGKGLDTTIIDGGNILTNSIGANQIAANAINASKISVRDYNNYVTVNENDANSLVGIVSSTDVSITNGWLYKSKATSSNSWVSPCLARWATPGEQYRVTCKVKMPSDGRFYVNLYSRDANNSSLGSNNTKIYTITANTETEINDIITVTDKAGTVKNNIAVAFLPPEGTSGYSVGYWKELKVERMSGGSLIVDGSITANKLAANSLVIDKMPQSTQEQILNSNIDIGGKNILRGSANPLTRATLWKYHAWYQTGGGGSVEWNVRLPNPPIPEITNGVKATINTANTAIGIAQACVPLRKGTVTLSCWIKASAGDVVNLQAVWSNSTSAPEGGSKTYTVADSEWHRYEHTYNVKYDHTDLDSNDTTNDFANAGYARVQSATTGRVAYICGVKLEYGNKATEWTASPDDYVDDSDNMLLDWDVPSLTKVKASNNRYWSGANETTITPSFQSLLEPPEEGIKYMQRYVATTATNARSRSLAFYAVDNLTNLPLKLNVPYTISFWARCTSGSGQARTDVNGASPNVELYTLTTEWKRFTRTFTITTQPTYYRIYIGGYFPANATGTVEVCGCRLVAGIDGDEAAKIANTANATANAAAPKTSAVKRTQRIYYQNNSTTAPATPGTTSSNWVTDNTGAANKWTKKRMSYATATPYIWTCEQSENAAGTVSYTSVLLDDTTTVIDGGKIITSSITANQIASNAITSSKLTVGAMPTGNLFLGATMDDRTNFTNNSNTDFTKHFRYYNGSASIHNFTEYTAGIYQDTITLTSATNLGIAFARLADEINLDPTANYTITCWAKCSSASLSLAIGLSYYNTSNTWVWRGGTNTTKFSSANTWQKFTLSFKPDADTKAICYCFTVAGGTGSETFTIRECRLEKAGVNQYITDIDSKDGIIIKAVNGTTDGSDTTKQNYVKLNASGLDIYQGGNSVAKYGSTARIGKDNERRIELSENSIDIYRNASDIAIQITSTGRINFGLEDGGVYIYERGLRSELMYNNNLWYSGYQSIAGTNPGIGSLAFWAGGHQKSHIGYNAEFTVGHNGLMKVNDVFQRPGRRTWVENGNLPTSGQPYTCVPFGLGSYVALGYLTNSAGSLRFSIPLGRTLPYDTEIESITFNMVVRAGNANAAGMYIVKKTSDGTDAVGFNSASNTVFYNGANISKTITASMVTKTLYGQTNIYISLDSGSNDFFSGNSTNTGYINNQPCAVHLSSILITPKYPANA